MGRMPEVGEIVDDVFRVERKLDSGNFGTVYKVTDLLERRTLALKVLRPGTHDEDELRRRFEREATLIYSLQHPHVVRVYYYGQTPSGLPYLAMEYLNGTDLRSLMHSYGQLHDALAKRVALETLSALQAAHALGIVHRDLKPANVYLVNDGHKGHVKVLDFGFAKAFDDEGAQQLTHAQTLVGTPAYMAPELVHKKDVGPPSDLYAVGLILAEMILGRKVVEAETIYDTILFQASNKPLEFPDELKAHPFFPVIERACRKRLSKRYDSAEAMMRDLIAVAVDGEQIEDGSPHLSAAERRAQSAASSGPFYAPVSQDDDNFTTRPASLGRPSLEEVDRALHASGPATLTATKSSHSSRIEPRSASPAPSAALTPQDSQYYVGPASARRRAGEPQTDPAAASPLAPLYDTASGSAWGPGSLDSELDLSPERPPQRGAARRAQRGGGAASVSRAILIGLLLGALAIALFVGILAVMT